MYYLLINLLSFSKALALMKIHLLDYDFNLKESVW